MVEMLKMPYFAKRKEKPGRTPKFNRFFPDPILHHSIKFHVNLCKLTDKQTQSKTLRNQKLHRIVLNYCPRVVNNFNRWGSRHDQFRSLSIPAQSLSLWFLEITQISREKVSERRPALCSPDSAGLSGTWHKTGFIFFLEREKFPGNQEPFFNNKPAL